MYVTIPRGALVRINTTTPKLTDFHGLALWCFFHASHLEILKSLFQALSKIFLVFLKVNREEVEVKRENVLFM